MFYKELLSKFYEELEKIKSKSPLLDEANLGSTLCTQTIGKMKKAVVKYGFENKNAEINFFRSVKVIPMQYLIYYIEVRSCELLRPKIGEKYQQKFLEEQTEKVNRFFGKYTEFLIYIDQGYTHFDKLYFTRKYINHVPLVKSYPYYKDPIFNTSHDGILARIHGLGLFINYLKNEKRKLEKANGSNKQNPLNWTGSYAAFIEMIYGCEAMGYFNNGNIEISTIIEELSSFLNIPAGNSSRTFNEIKNRKQSRIKFYEETGQKLLEKMDREDGIH